MLGEFRLVILDSTGERKPGSPAVCCCDRDSAYWFADKYLARNTTARIAIDQLIPTGRYYMGYKMDHDYHLEYETIEILTWQAPEPCQLGLFAGVAV
jgi:hypothetical protein